MKIIVFSDLDATLLDSETYSWEAARRAIQALKKRDASLVMVTSKTLAEVGALHRKLSFDDPFVFENGGGIAFMEANHRSAHLFALGSKGDEFEREGFAVLGLGTKYDVLVQSLAEISAEVRTPLVGFSAMSDKEVEKATGLPAEQALKARMRLFDEPFMIPEESKSLEAGIQSAAIRRGLGMVRGGRFWHLIGHAGKGKAVSILLEGFRKREGALVSVGLGDSPNDFPFLELVDIPVPLGELSTGEWAWPPAARVHRVNHLGPERWNQAVLDILASLQRGPAHRKSEGGT